MPTKTKRRAKGTGKLIKKSSGFYAFQYEDATGKRITESLKTKNRKLAQELADKRAEVLTAKDTLEAQQKIARTRELIHTDSLPLADVWTAFMATHPKCGPGTLSLYKAAWNRFAGWMAEHCPNVSDLGDVDKKIAQRFLDSVVDTGVSASRHNDIRGAIGTITKAVTARRNGIKNPWMETVRREDAQQQHHKPFTASHRAALADTLDELKDEHAPEYRLLFALGMYAGMRLIDAALLKVESVHHEFIQYTPEKTKRTSKVVCRVPILPQLREALDAVKPGEKYILPNLSADYIARPTSLKYRVTRIIDAAIGEQTPEPIEDARIQQRKPYSFHGLRTTFAIECVKVGVHAGQLRAMLGDHSATIDRFYVQVKNMHGDTPELGFRPFPALLSTGNDGHPDRARLRQLADELPLAQVRAIIKQIDG